MLHRALIVASLVCLAPLPAQEAAPPEPEGRPGAAPAAPPGERRGEAPSPPSREESGGAQAVPAAVEPGVVFVSDVTDLRALLPLDTTSFWHKTSGPGEARLRHHAEELASAVLDARFDAWLLDVLGHAGVPDGLVAELAGWRNLAATIGGLVPWRAVFAGEVLLAESRRPAFGGGPAFPSLLLAARPPDAARAELARALPACVASLSTLTPLHARYDVERTTLPDGRPLVHHALRVPALEEATLIGLVLVDDVVLIGFGASYLESAAALAGGALAPRLVDAPRLRAAFTELPERAAVRHYVDVAGLVEHAQDVSDLLASREFARGGWQGLLAESFALLDHVETVATVARCEGDRLVLETATRLDPTVPSGHPMMSAAFAAPASPALLEYVPADALSFSMRGSVDLAPLFRRFVDRVESEWSGGPQLVWLARVLGAAADVSVERDVLSWIGAEHVSVTVPARSRMGAPESIVVWQLEDAEGARKCLARLENVCAAAFGPLLDRLEDELAERGIGPMPRVRVVPGEGPFRRLRHLEITGLDLPYGLEERIPIPSPTYGVLGRTLVLTTSQDALVHCLSAAAREVPGLDEHPLAAEVFARPGVTSARLTPYGTTVNVMIDALTSLRGGPIAVLAGATEGTEAAWVPDALSELLYRVSDVLATLDDVGDAVTWAERRARGRVVYERTTISLPPWDGERDAIALAADGD